MTLNSCDLERDPEDMAKQHPDSPRNAGEMFQVTKFMGDFLCSRK